MYNELYQNVCFAYYANCCFQRISEDCILFVHMFWFNVLHSGILTGDLEGIIVSESHLSDRSQSYMTIEL